MNLNQVKCVNCGKSYMSPVKGDDTYCSAICVKEHYAKGKGRIVELKKIFENK